MMRQGEAKSRRADSPGGEFKRTFDIGMNNGELAFDAGSMLVGGGFTRGAIGLGLGGGGWSGEKDFGWTRYGPLDRLNYGTSPYTKAVVGPVLLGGSLTDAIEGPPQ